MEKKNDKMYDMIIVGGGPAGLSAAIYMARAKYKTLVIEKEKFGGQITITSEVVNYPGVFHTSGTSLTRDMQRQAEAFGAEFKLCEVLDLDLSKDIKTVKTTAGEYQTLGVILALGASPRQAGFLGEQEHRGRGVAYCATCDGEFFTNMPVYVVGGGFAAVEEGIFLTKYASEVHLIVRGDEFTCAKTISDKVYQEEKITVHFQTEVASVSGENGLQSIVLKDRNTNETLKKEYENGFGVFVFAGYVPNTEWLQGKVETNGGYLVTDDTQKTSVDGVYGAGDVCMKNLRQVVTAVSDGATAATSAEKYVASLHTKLNIPLFEVTGKPPKNSEVSEKIAEKQGDQFISDEMKEQLQPVFEKFEHAVTIKAVVDDSLLGKELAGLSDELKRLSEKIHCEVVKTDATESVPCLEIIKEDGTSSGIRFYAMPGGHEFNSFILALYNVAGPGKEIADEEIERIHKINKKINIKVLLSLSCTMCPEVVMGCGKIASQNENIEAFAMDLSHFPDLKEKYHVMSVPCMVVNDEVVSFGKKSIGQILDILEKHFFS